MPNRLAESTSPYLRQHADNPVDWWEWSDAAFDEARRRDVPVLLSVGYSACHWCHVMAHESLEDDATSEIMNRDFVNVKGDREERPDVDAGFGARPNAQVRDRVRQPLGEVSGHAILGEDPIRAQTRLPVHLELRHEDAGHSGVEVGVVEHDERGLATQLE